MLPFITKPTTPREHAGSKKPLNTGRADYFGVLANMAARVMALASPGQVPGRPRTADGTSGVCLVARRRGALRAGWPATPLRAQQVARLLSPPLPNRPAA